MDTYFASPERSGRDELSIHIDIATNNEVINGVLSTVGGLLAVLNENRQIVAVNTLLLETLGVKDRESVFGLRPGEAISCTHAHEMPGGCGTSRYCSTCGAAIAIVTSLCDNKAVERKCVAAVERDGVKSDICLDVRACPITVKNTRFVLLFLSDITDAENRIEYERMFYHDTLNIINGLSVASELMKYGQGNDNAELATYIQHLTDQLAAEVQLQNVLSQSDEGHYKPQMHIVELGSLVRETGLVLERHTEAEGKSFQFDTSCRESIKTDPVLLKRVITNMVVNALEATAKGGRVRLWVEKPTDGRIDICVWNPAHIPEDTARRVFQRHFSTKQTRGRGLGTYSMKLFGEKYLGAKVSFVSTAGEGTTFRISLPA